MSRLRERNDPANRLTWSVYYESQCPPVRVRIAWMRVDGLKRCQTALDGLTTEQQAAVKLAWARLERGDAIDDIGACFTRVDSSAHGARQSEPVRSVAAVLVWSPCGTRQASLRAVRATHAQASPEPSVTPPASGRPSA